MKKAIAICGSARKNGATAAILKKALEGAKDAGAETKLVYLHDLDFDGCRSCFECKRIGSPTYGTCAMRDDLTPVLERLTEADTLFFGAPMYYGAPAAEMLAFFERMLFPYHVYDGEKGLSTGLAQNRSEHITDIASRSSMAFPEGGTLWPRITNAAFFYTTDAGLGWRRDDFIRPLLKRIDSVLDTWTELKNIYLTRQYLPNYDQYYDPRKDGNHRQKHYETVFPLQLEEAYLIGKRLLMEDTYKGNNYRRAHFQFLNNLLGEDFYEVPEYYSTSYCGFKNCGLYDERFPNMEQYQYVGKQKEM